MEFSWLEDIWNWIVNNPLFSGAGGAVLAVIIGGIFRKKQKSANSIESTNNSGQITQSANSAAVYSIFGNNSPTVYTGVSIKEVQEFSTSLIQSECEKYTARALIEIEKRINEFNRFFLDVLQEVNFNFQTLSDPGKQYSIRNALAQYIRSDNKYTHEILIGLVKKRLNSDNQSILQIGSDDALANISSLTAKQMDLIFSLCALRYFQIMTNDFKYFTACIEEISNVISVYDKLSIIDFNNIISKGFMLDEPLAVAWYSEENLGENIYYCNKEIFDRANVDMSTLEKIKENMQKIFPITHRANERLGEIALGKMGATPAALVLTDIVFFLRFPHIKRASLHSVLNNLVG